MDDRWLRSVEELLVREEEEDAPWDGGYADEALEDEYDYYELPADDPRRGTLTEVVLLEGEVIDVRRPPVQGSGYECAALELGHRRPKPRVERVVVHEPLPNEPMRQWLARVVGSEAALAGLDVMPLPGPEPLEVSQLPEDSRDLAVVVDEHLERAAEGWVVRDEALTASRRLLVIAAQAGMLRAWRDLPPEKVAATIVHCMAKANALVGNGAAFTVAHWLRDLGTSAAPHTRSLALAKVIGGRQWPHGRPPADAPEVYLLGDPQLLIGRFRRELIDFRDLADRWAAHETPTDAAESA